MKKRMIALLIALALMLSVMPTVFAAEPASGTCGEDARWVLDANGKLTVSGTGTIQSLSFDGNTDIVELVIEEGITHIDGAAFRGCANLKSVSFPESLKGFNMSSFGKCTSLESVEIPANVGFLPEGVFSGCTSLKTITLHEGLTGFGRCALSGCASLESITIPETVTDIQTNAFGWCTSLKSITLPASVESVDLYAFEGCSSLTGIWVDENNPIFYSDEHGVLYGTNYKGDPSLYTAPDALSGSYVIPDGITFAYAKVFDDCSNLKEVTIPGSLQTVMSGMFENCTGLESVTISAGVEEIWMSAFNSCTSLKNVYFEGDALTISDHVFENVTATCYYPVGNETWTEEVMKDYGGSLTWVPLDFMDVLPDTWYADEVKWAVDNGITTGMDANTFAPAATCNRAQVVTFLWRAAGSPAPESTDNPFVDVPAGQFYTDAVLWAVENGITSGADETHFNPNGACSRAQVVTFLHRAAGSPAPESSENPFVDVPSGEFYTDAVLWAVEQGITNGIDNNHFAPYDTCNRAQIVTFLYRYLAE